MSYEIEQIAADLTKAIWSQYNIAGTERRTTVEDVAKKAAQMYKIIHDEVSRSYRENQSPTNP